ncbi:MAG: 4Fe-4S cluster-binding domain-containing protein [Desulfobulbaceae bacterium]|nr:4Fe-4S cluster-binding domain-containing protein [Desulfobulbaceae bacterium]
MEPAKHLQNRLPLNFTHPRFGDLTRPQAVTLAAPPEKLLPPFCEKDLAYIHLSVTGRCNARCKGCINSTLTNSFTDDRRVAAPIQDTVPERDAACILHLLAETDKQEAVICFYGGEPLLAMEKIMKVKEIIDHACCPLPVRYMLYTNGSLLEKAVADHPGFFKDLWLTSISIDGRRAQHEAVRAGTDLPKIHQGLRALRRVAAGKTLMWSTLRENQSLADCFAEFLDLHEQQLLDLFFWHWVETEQPYERFADYCARYEADLETVMAHYLARLREGRILPVIHVNELVIFALTGLRRNSSGCGVEVADNFDLLDGKIHSCADLPPEMAIGHIDDQGHPHIRPVDLTSLVAYKTPLGCYQCGVHDYCGGRCPVQAQISSGERLRQYCQLMRLHVGIVLSHLDEIRQSMAAHHLTPQHLYDQAAFYAQFTDVTP